MYDNHNDFTLYDTIVSLQHAGFDMKQCAITTTPHTTDTDKRTTTITLVHANIPVTFVVTVFTYLPRGMKLTENTAYDLREAMADMFCDYVSIQTVTKHGRVIDSLSADYSDKVGRYGSVTFDAVVKTFREIVDYMITVYRLSH